MRFIIWFSLLFPLITSCAGVRQHTSQQSSLAAAGGISGGGEQQYGSDTLPYLVEKAEIIGRVRATENSSLEIPEAVTYRLTLDEMSRGNSGTYEAVLYTRTNLPSSLNGLVVFLSKVRNTGVRTILEGYTMDDGRHEALRLYSSSSQLTDDWIVKQLKSLDDLLVRSILYKLEFAATNQQISADVVAVLRDFMAEKNHLSSERTAAFRIVEKRVSPDVIYDIAKDTHMPDDVRKEAAKHVAFYLKNTKIIKAWAKGEEGADPVLRSVAQDVLNIVLLPEDERHVVDDKTLDDWERKLNASKVEEVRDVFSQMRHFAYHDRIGLMLSTFMNNSQRQRILRYEAMEAFIYFYRQSEAVNFLSLYAINTKQTIRDRQKAVMVLGRIKRLVSQEWGEESGRKILQDLIDKLPPGDEVRGLAEALLGS